MYNKLNTTNQIINFYVPDNFHLMDDKELLSIGGNITKDTLNYRDEKNHLLLSVAKKKIPLISRWVDLSKVKDNTKRTIKSRTPEYKEIKDLKYSISGYELEGFTYSYKVQNINQSATYLLMSIDNFYISIHFVGRTDTFSDLSFYIDDIISNTSIE